MDEKTDVVPVIVKRMAGAMGIASGVLAVGNGYNAMHGLVALSYISSFGFLGYGFGVIVLEAVAAVVLAGEAYLMLRMYREWKNADADRYFTGMVVIGVVLIAVDVLNGLIMPGWARYVPGWVWENLSVSVCGIVSYYLVCKACDGRLSLRFSARRIREDVRWIFGKTRLGEILE